MSYLSYTRSRPQGEKICAFKKKKKKKEKKKRESDSVLDLELFFVDLSILTMIVGSSIILG
jgi:hypothetical protein